MKCHYLPTVMATLALSGLVACGHSDADANHRINGSVHVGAGQPATSLATVNGSVRVDDNAAATSLSTVNGSIHLGAHASADSATTVNGSITLDDHAHVAGSLSTVNGPITLQDAAEVSGTVSNVNGKIELMSAHVGGGLKTSSGSISVLGNSQVTGGILVEKPGNEISHLSDDVPRIIIGPGATIQGELRFERKVSLYVSDRSTIGAVTGATPVTFNGNLPPQ